MRPPMIGIEALPRSLETRSARAAFALALVLLLVSPLVARAQETLPAEALPEVGTAADVGSAAPGEDTAPAAAIPGLGTAASGWVVDEAGLLPEGVRRELDVLLADHEARTSNQVVVLTVPSLGGLEIEEFAVGEATRRGIGQRGKDNGVLFVVAPNERAARIEVGYGLEGALPDARAGRILRTEVVPRFRDGDYPGGIEAGVDAILASIDGSYRPTLADRLPLQGVIGWFDGLPDLPIFEQAFLGMFFFIFGPILSILPLAWLRWKGLGNWIGLAFFLCLAVLVLRRYPWFLGGFGLFGILLLLARLDKMSGGKLSRGRTGGGGGGGRGGGGGSSYRSSSSSSSRSFSGGGGSFGGGGASSRW